MPLEAEKTPAWSLRTEVFVEIILGKYWKIS